MLSPPPQKALRFSCDKIKVASDCDSFFEENKHPTAVWLATGTFATENRGDLRLRFLVLSGEEELEEFDIGDVMIHQAADRPSQSHPDLLRILSSIKCTFSSLITCCLPHLPVVNKCPRF